MTPRKHLALALWSHRGSWRDQFFLSASLLALLAGSGASLAGPGDRGLGPGLDAFRENSTEVAAGVGRVGEEGRDFVTHLRGDGRWGSGRSGGGWVRGGGIGGRCRGRR